MFQAKELQPETLADYISLSTVPQAWRNCWQECQSKYQKDWLDQYDFTEIADFYQLDRRLQDRLTSEIKQLQRDEKLNFLCYLLYYLLFEDENGNSDSIWSWQVNPDVFAKHGSWMICVVTLLCGYPLHLENMQKRNFDDYQINQQKQNINSICNFDHHYYQLDGIRFSQMAWGSIFIRGNIIQVGRLQYEIVAKKQDTLASIFPENAIFLSIHIPRGESLSSSEVEQSLAEAPHNIRKYCPEWKDKELVFFTDSWLLSPELREFLPESSNIIRFQKRFQLIETGLSRNAFLQFAFDLPFSVEENELLPETTTLQRELKKRLLEGQSLHVGVGYIENDFTRPKG